MKKTQKKILGLCGLGAVVATTALAAALPTNPEALATSVAVNSVTDTIQVRVLGTAVKINITQPDPTSDLNIVNPEREIAFNYENANDVTSTLYYTNVNGHTEIIDEEHFTPNYEPGAFSKTFNLNDYGYGHYKLIVEGEGAGGETNKDSVAFNYLPVTGTAAQVGQEERVKVDLNYDTSNTSRVKAVRLDVLKNGIHTGKVVWVNYPTKTTDIDFSRMVNGNYTIMATAYGENNLPLFAPFPITVNYQSPYVPVPVPHTGDTGGMFKDGSVSQTDYLVTGLMVFGIVAVAGIAFIMRNDKKTHSKKSGRRK
ncbi:hypothetical protein IKE80_00175 [Candidatus Saccharibacteria bacterium]|nr:hypothetical protein [Candidatus Saccharibacteria bacterium]